jgi:proteasome lid subunit RPN8/RPN11
MDAEISFGEFRESQPSCGVAPDRNPHWALAWVGESTDSIPIFVELDAMRELESHALENINVELGGVLLGEHSLDDQGRPFIVVRDSLRAEHYEATRGSFKFTHQTWESISRQREQFPDAFAVVGWYHTHPGWGVFLSDMDLFICHHFFNRPLDVALVIDPVRDERGWFAWSSEGTAPVARRQAGFGLIAHRQRADEVQAVATFYNERKTMSADPRLRITSPGPSSAPITIVERPLSTAFNIGIGVLLLGQLMLMTSILWRGFESPSAQTASATHPDVELLLRERQAKSEADLYRRLLHETVESTPDSAGIVDRVRQLTEQSTAQQANLEGQAALVEQLKQQFQTASQQLVRATLDHKATKEQLAQRDTEARQLQAKLDALSALPKAPPGLGLNAAAVWGVAVALVAAIAGGLGGYFWFRRQYVDLLSEAAVDFAAYRERPTDAKPAG